MGRFCSKRGMLSLAFAASLAGTAALAAGAPPDFSATAQTAWVGIGIGAFLPVPGSPQPIGQDPAYRYIPNGTPGQQPTQRISDIGNPNLKQWAKDVMKKDNDEVLKGKIGFTPSSSCKQPGVPASWLAGGPFFFIQTANEVMIIEEGDRHARRIRMTGPHSANPKPSWYGESVGHYEGSDLVVDTIGFNTKTFVDNYRTPHSDQIHVVERFRIVEGGKTLQVTATVEDPGAFNIPWSAVQRWKRGPYRQILEQICAENSEGFYDYDVVPIPQAAKPDF